jgi:hypothetical protein
MTIKRYGRHWAVYDEQGALIAVTVYKNGALEVLRRLRQPAPDKAAQTRIVRTPEERRAWALKNRDIDF